ncbi:MAG: M61 family peptidase, partial [Hymenobacteraceae bacterium]|nr:M61 family peptidase [Hymenobacteraceae bacterium]MDX5396206.1 M61 family peptidase [Hymenobacteraceae bacterium]MDX5512269.1 M61 family peptidase [Hymenobacteraceae bacterium]
MLYNVSFQSTLSSYIDIKLHIPDVQQPELYLQLPAWRPGRYELQNFAQKIKKLQAFNEQGQELQVQKTTKDRWQVSCAGAKAIDVTYTFYARQMDAGGSWLDDEQLYLNGV